MMMFAIFDWQWCEIFLRLDHMRLLSLVIMGEHRLHSSSQSDLGTSELMHAHLLLLLALAPAVLGKDSGTT